MRRQVFGLLLLLGALRAVTTICFAERLPVKTYTTAEGLPRDQVTFVRQDSRGFIWLAAGDGISRFDGYKFTNYTTEDGLADRRVNDLLETKHGVYWIATDGGLCRFNPKGLSKSGRRNATTIQHDESGLTIEPTFVVYNPTEKPIAFTALLEDETGAIWCATGAGLYRLEVSPDGEAKFHFIDLGNQAEKLANPKLISILKDRQGALWCGTDAGKLHRLLPDGRVERYSDENGLSGLIISLLEDREGNIWAGTRKGQDGELLRLVGAPDPSRSIVARVYGAKDGLASGWINYLSQGRDGRLWAATTTGLYSISLATDASVLRLQLYNAKNGLCTQVWDMTEDRDGNLWVASDCGVQKVGRHGFRGYELSDGLTATQINSIFESRDGTLFVISRDGSPRIVNRFDGARFQSVKPNLPPIEYHGWGWGQTIIQDHLGEWWVPGYGLYRFPKVDRVDELAQLQPQFVRTVGDDFRRTEIFRLYEDKRGDIWMATTGLSFNLLRWERATNIVHDHTAETNVPPSIHFAAFCEDGGGNLWIGTAEGGGLLRYRDGKFKRFTTDDRVPPGWIISLYLDQAGRLWIASSLGGLNRIDNPTSDTLQFTRYTTADGLSSNNIRAITEDEWGRIYVGSGHGVDRLELGSGGVKHFTAADGLPKGAIECAQRDRTGALWFGSVFGLSRFVPEKQQSLTLPSVYLTGLRIAGVPQPVSEIGVVDLPTLYLAPSQKHLSVDFVGLGASLGEELRYQYSLAGGTDVWSAPTTERTIHFANLAHGAYRFRVRAIDADGRVSAGPATFAFNIAAPVWQRWWFVSLIVALMGLTIYSVYRYRLGRLLELERVRTRIATDLHDDVGSGLSQVSILSELIKRRVGPENGVAEELSTIGTLSRDLVDSMSDIVWAINPGRDRLSDLSQRMRRFASDVFTAQGVKFSFDVPKLGRDIALGPDTRRELYLIFKEAVNNVVRHSGCTKVEIAFRISDGALELSVRDNGRGFDLKADSDGNGLENMCLRAKKLRGDIQISSSHGVGTAVNLSVPLASRGWFALGLKRNRS